MFTKTRGQLMRAYHSKPYRHTTTPLPMNNCSHKRKFPPGTKSFVQLIKPAATKASIIYINWIKFKKSDVLTSVLPNIQVFWDVTHCRYVSRSQLLEDMQYLHRQGQTFFWNAWYWRWRHYDPSEHHEPLVQWHSITSEKTWKFNLSFNYRTGNHMT